MQTDQAIDMSPSGLTPSQMRFRAAHRERLARMAEAAARRPAPVCRTREYRPFVSDVVEIKPPQSETPEQWAERQKLIPIPQRPYEPWFSIEADITPPAAEPRRPSIERIQRACACYYGVGRDDIISARRTANVVRPRQVAMYLAKTLTLRSLPEIGRRFGGRDHTTALHAIRKIGALILSDADLAYDVAQIEASILEAK